MQAALGNAWSYHITRKGARARWGWLTVTLKKKSDGRWRARLRDGFPRQLIEEAWSEDPIEALSKVSAVAKDAKALCSGSLTGWGPTYLGHRVWQAVRR